MQEVFDFLTQFVSRPDQIIMNLIDTYGYWIYVFLFLIIFAETGLIVAAFLMPFLPGDALIFAIGMIAASDAQNHLHLEFIIPLLMFAALLGDNVNYYIGRRFGDWIKANPGKFFIKSKHLNKATKFFEFHGQKAIIIARFMPVIRTIVPFVCGSAKFDYKMFLKYSFIGAILWVGVIASLGFLLGKNKFVQENLELFIFGIIIFANLPLIVRLIKNRFSKSTG